MQMYENDGYSQRDAAQCILENNLFGLDIDERAAQLAYFAVMMKARQYDRRIFSRGIQPHVYAIAESNDIDTFTRDYFANNDPKLKAALDSIMNDLRDAKEYGSILTVAPVDFAALYARMEEVKNDISFHKDAALNTILPLIHVAEALAQKYDVVVTNPPYMGSANMDARLSEFVKKHYPDSKSDLFAVFIERCGQMTDKNRYQAMITQHAWMFLSSFEKLRAKLLLKDTVNMVHLGPRAFEEIGGEVVQTTSFVLRNSNIADYKGTYCRLIEPTTQQGKEDMFLAGENRYTAQQSNFSKIPGSPVAYWASKKILDAYSIGGLLGDTSDVKIGMGTGKNDIFVREWWEVNSRKIDYSLTDIGQIDFSKARYFPYNKGGEFRLWYGNLQEVLWFDAEGRTYMNTMSGHRENGAHDWYCHEGLTWSFISSSKFGVRYLPTGCFFDVAGSTLFSRIDNKYTLGFLSSCVCFDILRILNPTLNYQAGNIKSLPIIFSHEKEIDSLVDSNINLSKYDWDSYEPSWDFLRHPLIRPVSRLTDAYTAWKAECEQRFLQLKANEEELNRIFIDIYGLQDELTSEVEDKDVTVHRIFDTKDDVPESMQGSSYVRTKRDEIVSLLSYAVGCMFGRYSLDVDGLAYAGGRFSDQWVVVSGQLINRKVVEECVSQELSRAFGMAEVDVAGRGDIPASETAAERGAICLIRPDAAGSGVGSIQYRRGTSKKLYEGICELPLHFPGVSGGTGNPVYDLCSPEILDALTNRNGAELVRRGWKDAERFDWEAVHWSLTTDHFSPDRDGILPITDEEYLEDDIISRLCDWLKAAYGADTLEENLDFIAEALGGKGGSSREIIRSYFLKDFFKDHCKTYQKRPIYWLFDSGKQNGFKALIYLHRYTPDTIGNLRVDYLHKMQRVYESEINRMQDMIDHSTNVREVAASTKRKEKLQKQLKECRDYDEMIAHLALSRIELDLDDGVKVNYEKIQTSSDGKKYAVLAKI